MQFDLRMSLDLIDIDSENKINTYNDWGLIPEGKIWFKPPEQIFNFVDVPGSNDPIDLTYALVKYPTFNKISGSISFKSSNDLDKWADLDDTIRKFTIGKKMKVINRMDPDWHYLGYFYISEYSFDSSGAGSSITFAYDFAPYRSFNEITDVIFTTDINNKLTLVVNKDLLSVVPVIPNIWIRSSIGSDNGKPIVVSFSNPELSITISKEFNISAPPQEWEDALMTNLEGITNSFYILEFPNNSATYTMHCSFIRKDI